LRLKILEKLRSASLNSEFTGSYKFQSHSFPVIRLYDSRAYKAVTLD